MTAVSLPEPRTVGFIGLGAMGLPIVRHLVAQGFDLAVYDVNAVALDAARQSGARVMGSVAEVANEARLVMVCLPSLDAARAVLLGPEGVAQASACKILFDLSTTGPAFAREMREALAARGIDYLDAPITGNVTTAGNGRLGLMCSGPAAAYELALPVLKAMAASTVLFLGEQAGRAQTLKLLNNLVSACGMALTSEAFVIATRMGLRPTMLLEAINSTDASTNASRNKFAPSVLPRQFNYGARMAITAKDISFAVQEAEQLGVPAWVARPVQQLWRYAVSQGGADRDGSALITYLEPWAGVEVRGDSAPAFRAAPAPGRAAPCVVICEPERVGAVGDWLQRWHLSLTVCEWPTGPSVDCWVQDIPDGAVIVNTALTAPELADALRAAVVAKGRGYVDAPIACRPADLGSAPVFVAGGEDSLAMAWPLLQALGETVHIVSHHAADAQRVRLIEEALSAALFAVACESYVTAVKAGLEAQTVPRILGIETGRTAASATIFPQQVLTRQFNDGRTLARASQALELLGSEAEALGISAWAMNSARLLYRLGCAQLGGDADMTRLAQLYETWAGVVVRAGAQED